jgi:hypothetical protein
MQKHISVSYQAAPTHTSARVKEKREAGKEKRRKEET